LWQSIFNENRILKQIKILTISMDEVSYNKKKKKRAFKTDDYYYDPLILSHGDIMHEFF